MRPKTKNILTFLAKFSLAALIIYWPLKSGKLQFHLLKESLNYPKEWLICLSILAFNIFLSSYRWKKILEVQDRNSLPAMSMWRFNWIGNFFNSVLPGAVSGDFIKLFYIRKLRPHLTKSFLVISVFIDRLFGLLALLSIMGVTCYYFYDDLITRSENIEKLIHFNFLLFSGVFLVMLSILIPAKIQTKILSLMKRIPLIGDISFKLFSSFWFMGQSKKVLAISFVTSIIIQMLSITAFWTLTKPFFHFHPDIISEMQSISFFHALSFIPLGLISLAVPITPSGIGVGHVIFDKLFALFGITNGAALFNFYFISNLLINLLGAIPYLKASKTPKESDLEEFAKEI